MWSWMWSWMWSSSSIVPASLRYVGQAGTAQCASPRRPSEHETEEKNDHDEPEPGGESLVTDGAPGSSDRRALDDWHDLDGLKIGLVQSDDLGLAHAGIAKHGGRLVRRRGHAG